MTSRWIAAATAVAAVALAVVACRPNATTVEPPADPGPALPVVGAGPDYFEDVTDRTGVKFTYGNGEEAKSTAIPEPRGGGGAVSDSDGDGLLDLYIPGGGYYEGKDGKTYWDEFKAAAEKRRTDPNAPMPAGPKIRGFPGRLYRNLGGFK